MKESDKNMEDFIKKVMAEDTLESPSIDFTQKIMSQISVAEKSNIKNYKPLISKQIWMIIGAALIVLTIYAFVSGNDYNFKMSKLYVDSFSNLLSGFNFSEKVMYAILIVPFMILIQIPILKNYYEKKYQF